MHSCPSENGGVYHYIFKKVKGESLVYIDVLEWTREDEIKRAIMKPRPLFDFLSEECEMKDFVTELEKIPNFI